MGIQLTGVPALYLMICDAGLPEPILEHRFAPPRRFAFDLAWPEVMLAAEQEGGLFGKGKPCPLCGRRPAAGHGAPKRIKSDMEKYNLAALQGWTLIRFLPEHVGDGTALAWVRAALAARGYGGDSGGEVRP